MWGAWVWREEAGEEEGGEEIRDPGNMITHEHRVVWWTTGVICMADLWDFDQIKAPTFDIFR